MPPILPALAPEAGDSNIGALHAFDKQLTGLLHQAEREIATGRAEAKRALAQLGH